MKKIVFMGLMFFIIISRIFADESSSKFENINFIFLNPLFFGYNTSLKYPLRNINISIFTNIDIYLKDPKEYSLEDYLFDRTYNYDDKLAGFFYFYYQLFKLIDTYSGGPEKRRKEELEDNKRYNILHPSEPPKKTIYWE
jgi:hypothetical protein